MSENDELNKAARGLVAFNWFMTFLPIFIIITIMGGFLVTADNLLKSFVSQECAKEDALDFPDPEDENAAPPATPAEPVDNNLPPGFDNAQTLTVCGEPFNGEFIYGDGWVSPTGWVEPTIGVLTSPFGWRIHPVWGGWRKHTGIDVATYLCQNPKNNIALVAASDGIVQTVRGNWEFMSPGEKAIASFGNNVSIKHPDAIVDPITGETKDVYTVYAHIKQGTIPANIYPGAVVKAGQPVGAMGNTGVSSGCHLHFETRIGKNLQDLAVDPIKFYKTFAKMDIY